MTKPTEEKMNSRQRIQVLASRIEHDIRTGHFGSGAWLKQIELEELYGSPRLDVRQALGLLADRGLVELIPQRGARVMAFDKRKLQNNVELRALLESGAIEMLCGRIDEKGFAVLTQLAEAFHNEVLTGTLSAQEEANHAFHRTLLSWCQNDDLMQLIFELRNRVPLSVRRERNTTMTMLRTAQEHFTILEHLRRKDAEAARQAMRRHVIGRYDEDFVN